MKKTGHVRFGARGEELAARYLEDRGYTILEKNYRSGRKEIDIIAKDRETLVFVEVKSRSGQGMIPPYMSVGPRKRSRILRVASAYVKHNELPRGTDIRFDVISVVVAPGTSVEIDHIEDAFRPA